MRVLIWLIAVVLVLQGCTSAYKQMSADYSSLQPQAPDQNFNSETYDRIKENEFQNALQRPLSTFSIDVDTASYSNMRRFLAGGSLPPKDSIRVEEFINYFPYEYAVPKNGQPFSVDVEVAQTFWNPDHQLMRIGIKGQAIDWKNRPNSNIVFLLDVSGSMHSLNKLHLVKRSLKLVLDTLGNNDRVAIVVYAGASGLVLPSTSAGQKGKILAAIDELIAGGSTNGGEGIELAYKVAQENFILGGINRVVLATDGDFNIGVTNQGDLTRLIEAKANSGVYLTVLGFGMGNYKDSILEKLADMGSGNYAYIDNIQEARKVLVEQVGGTMITIAKDVKIQVEFNPQQVASYRLIGYENRRLKDEDFNDDTKDAGDIGSGHTVTAVYEIVPSALNRKGGSVDNLKYLEKAKLSKEAYSGELATVKVRYKTPDSDKSQLITNTVTMKHKAFDKADQDFRFAAGVVSFGMLLRDSKFKGETSFGKILTIVDKPNLINDNYRKEFVDLVKKAMVLADKGSPKSE